MPPAFALSQDQTLRFIRRPRSKKPPNQDPQTNKPQHNQNTNTTTKPSAKNAQPSTSPKPKPKQHQQPKRRQHILPFIQIHLSKEQTPPQQYKPRHNPTGPIPNHKERKEPHDYSTRGQRVYLRCTGLSSPGHAPVERYLGQPSGSVKRFSGHTECSPDTNPRSAECRPRVGL
jgi:hypothetical protein